MNQGVFRGGGGELAPEELRRLQRRAWWGYLALVIGNFMAILDIQIVASSINEIQAGLSASTDEIQWLQSSYLIAEVIGIPLSAYLSRLLSTRVYFVTCSVGFAAASVGCALSWSLGSMVIFRVLQGFLGGGMIPTTFATLYILFPEERRVVPRVLSGMMAMSASALGPTIGGFITGLVSWHWLFLLNLLPGLGCAYAVWLLIDIDKPQPEMLKLTDFWGLAFMALFLGSMEYTLDAGPRKDWMDDDAVATTAVLAVIGGTLFFHRVLSTAHPIVDLRAFHNRNFAIGSSISMLLGMITYTLVYLTPLFLGQVRGFSPLQIGQVMLSQGAAMFLSAPLAGRLIRIMGPRSMMALGLTLVIIGTLLNTRLTADWGIWEFFVPQVLRGCGFVICYVPTNDVALGTMPAHEVKNASGLYAVTRNIGGAIGLALLTTLINLHNWNHWQALAQNLRLSRAPVRDALSSMQHALTPELGSHSGAAAVSWLAQITAQQAAVLTYADMFRMLAYLAMGALLLVSLVAKPQRHIEDAVP